MAVLCAHVRTAKITVLNFDLGRKPAKPCLSSGTLIRPRNFIQTSNRTCAWSRISSTANVVIGPINHAYTISVQLVLNHHTRTAASFASTRKHADQPQKTHYVSDARKSRKAKSCKVRSCPSIKTLKRKESSSGGWTRRQQHGLNCHLEDRVALTAGG